jgi:hypothetical protein
MSTQLAPDEFIIIGLDARVDFRPNRVSKFPNAQFLRVKAEHPSRATGAFRVCSTATEPSLAYFCRPLEP